VRRITVHDTRHTCATLLATLDVHPRVAMHILRHAQIDVTVNVYTEVSDERRSRRSSNSASNSIRRRCCTSLLYGMEKGRLRSSQAAFDLCRGGGI
jgi:hypothetical protein